MRQHADVLLILAVATFATVGTVALVMSRADEAPVEEAPVAEESPVEAAAPVVDAVGYAATVLADEPVAYWRFEEQSGIVAADDSGRDRPAVYVNGPSFAADVGMDGTGRALSIHDTDEGVRADYAPWTDLSALTVEVWVQPSTVTSTEGMIIVDKGSTWNLFLDPQGRPAFQFPGNVPPEALSATPLVAGETYHLAATFGSGVMRLYVNGALVSEASGLAPSIPSNPTQIHVGRGLSAGRFGVRGVIDEVALYDRALSADAVLRHYDAGR